MTHAVAEHLCTMLLSASLGQVPEAVGLVSEAAQETLQEVLPDAAAEPASSWMLPLIGGAVVLGLSLVSAGAWFAWNKRQASRDQQELATHALAKRAGLSTPELRAIQDLVACVRGNPTQTSENASTLGLIMSPHAAAELARTLPVTAMDGFDRKQLSRALDKLGAPGALDIKPRPKPKPNTGTRVASSAGSGAPNAAQRALPTKGQEAIAARARAVLAAINRAKAEGYFDAKVGGPEVRGTAVSAKPSTRGPATTPAKPPEKTRAKAGSNPRE